MVPYDITDTKAILFPEAVGFRRTQGDEVAYTLM
jgi:hypothetical protein